MPTKIHLWRDPEVESRDQDPAVLNLFGTCQLECALKICMHNKFLCMHKKTPHCCGVYKV